MNRGYVNYSAPNLLSICVDRVGEQSYEGRIYHKYSCEPQRFQDIGDMIRIMGALFDRCGYPQSSTQSRSFQDKTDKTLLKEASQVSDTDQVIKQNGELATFVVHVKHRQHSTWQGEVVWADKREKRTFRSALELLKLIDGALEEDEVEER